MPRPSVIRLRSPLLPVVVAVLIFLQVVLPYRGWTVLLVAFGGVLVLATAWARSMARGLSVSRETRFSWQRVGDTMLERVTLRNASRFPALWLEIDDHSTMPGVLRSFVGWRGPRSSFRSHREFLCESRGLFTLGPTTVRTGDAFGIYEVEVHDPASSATLVMPSAISVSELTLLRGSGVGEGEMVERSLMPTVSASRTAAYQAGDSLRWIHWPTSARRETLHVRRFDSATEGELWIVLDLDSAVQAGEGGDSTVELGVTLAASIAERALGLNLPVGLVTQSGGERWTWLSPRATTTWRWQILYALAIASEGAGSLGTALDRLAQAIDGPCALVLITPNTGSEWTPSLIRTIRSGATASVLLLEADRGRSTADCSDALARLGIACSVIDAERLRRPERGEQPLPRQARWRALA